MFDNILSNNIGKLEIMSNNSPCIRPFRAIKYLVEMIEKSIKINWID